MNRVLLVDNYDSFTYNVVQALRILGAEVEVRTSDDVDVKSARSYGPTHLVISPGPGRPEDATGSMSIVEAMLEDVPILGVCLGLPDPLWRPAQPIRGRQVPLAGGHGG
jgi:anthranilate/para-aminobenzoate synthase component II